MNKKVDCIYMIFLQVLVIKQVNEYLKFQHFSSHTVLMKLFFSFLKSHHLFHFEIPIFSTKICGSFFCLFLVLYKISFDFDNLCSIFVINLHHKR